MKTVIGTVLVVSLLLAGAFYVITPGEPEVTVVDTPSDSVDIAPVTEEEYAEKVLPPESYTETPVTEEPEITVAVEEQPTESTPVLSAEPEEPDSIKPTPRNSRFTDEYDPFFREWTKVYLPFHDYTLLKAQCYQESLLNPTAVSPVGAKGLCQFMDFTWSDVSKPLGFSASDTAYDPELSVQAAAYYDARLRRSWKSERPEKDRMNLVFASYNAGMGHILKAQKLCGGVNLYDDIIKCLPDVTGHHSKETMTYVIRIRKWEGEMQFE